MSDLHKKYLQDIAQNIEGKSGFEIIEGINCSFQNFKAEFETIKQSWFDFFSGKRNELLPYSIMEVNFIPGSVYSNLLKKECESQRETFNKTQVDKVLNYGLDIMEFVALCSKFYTDNFKNFEMYESFKMRLEKNLGFADIDRVYITFPEFKIHYEEIKDMEDKEFIAWYKAQKLL
jgi:hypothetical protein